MLNFEYKGISHGKYVEGQIEALNNSEAAHKLKEKKVIIGFGSPAKATTALNFFGISNQIDFIVEDNKLKHKKFIPGVKIPIHSKEKIKDINNTMLVLAWNFFDDIKKNNKGLSKNFINIKSLEKDI